MFEFPTDKKEHPTEAEIRADLESKEKETRKTGVSFLENLAPEKFKENAARALAAALLVFTAASFAGEQDTNKDNLPDMGEEQILKKIEKDGLKNQIADFDWKKMAGKIEISVGGEKEDVKEFNPEAVLSAWYGSFTSSSVVVGQDSQFYKGVTTREASRAYYAVGSSIINSQNSAEFFSNLNALSQKGESMSDRQKAIALQSLGAQLHKTYNYDMLEAGTHVSVSDDAMFSALKDIYLVTGADPQAGICGNIAIFLDEAAKSLGVKETWIQNGSTEGGPHIWNGMILGEGAEKEIVWLDGEYLLPTDTINYEDALVIPERFHKNVATINGYVGGAGEVLFPVKSRAQKITQEAIGIEGAVNILDKNLDNDKIEKEGRNLEINISPEIKKIKLSSDCFALAFFNFEDSTNNPYQALEGMNAVSVSAHAGGENLEAGISATALYMNVKGINEPTSAIDEVVAKISLNYLEKNQLNKSKYGEFLAEVGATFEGALKLPPGMKNLKEGSAEAAIGAKLIYIDPNNAGKFYIDATESFRGQINDFAKQKSIAKKVSENIALGAEVKVMEGTVINLKVGKSNFDWGKGSAVEVSLAGEKLEGRMGYEKKSSDFERFIPSSEKIEVGVGYKGGPKWEVDVIGAKTLEKYKDADNKSTTSAEVKLKIMLW